MLHFHVRSERKGGGGRGRPLGKEERKKGTAGSMHFALQVHLFFSLVDKEEVQPERKEEREKKKTEGGENRNPRLDLTPCRSRGKGGGEGNRGKRERKGRAYEPDGRC